MKILIKIDRDKCGDEYLKSNEKMIEISSCDEFIFIEYNDELLRIPKNVFFGVINN